LPHSLDEWKNFLERIGVEPDNEVSIKGRMDDIRLWASYRGQTLARTGNMVILSFIDLPNYVFSTYLILTCYV